MLQLIRFFLCFLFLSILPVQAITSARLKAVENRSITSGKLDLAVLAVLVTNETNRFRSEHGRAPLKISNTLGKAAQDHATQMTRHRFFAHLNPYDREQRTIDDRIARVGLQPVAFGENIAMNFSRDFTGIRTWIKKGRRGRSPGTPDRTYRKFAAVVVDQWIHSAGHRRNLLRKEFDEIGLGFSRLPDAHDYETIYCVQTFSSTASRVGRLTRTRPSIY